jgi:AraC-like DNA-binding protein
VSPRQLHGHGTRGCYLRGCRRPECAEAHRRYCKAYRSTTYKTGPLRVDAAPAARACRAMADAGWSEHQIAAAAGCSEKAVHCLLAGLHPTVTAATANKILRADPRLLDTPPWTYVDATGTTRRCRALFAMGYFVADIAAAAGITRDPLSRILNQDPGIVRANTAQSITAVYIRWSRTPGPSKRNRTLAMQRGWHSPIAWGDDIDDPAAVPECALEGPPLAHRAAAQERAAEALHLFRLKVTPPEIAARTGLSVSRVREQITEARERLHAELVPA